ncbi:hypothetical protein U1Q18_000249 [Sarracenia purpurea var. burkii]
MNKRKKSWRTTSVKRAKLHASRIPSHKQRSEAKTNHKPDRQARRARPEEGSDRPDLGPMRGTKSGELNLTPDSSSVAPSVATNRSGREEQSQSMEKEDQMGLLRGGEQITRKRNIRLEISPEEIVDQSHGKGEITNPKTSGVSSLLEFFSTEQGKGK